MMRKSHKNWGNLQYWSNFEEEPQDEEQLRCMLSKENIVLKMPNVVGLPMSCLSCNINSGVKSKFSGRRKAI
jgi:hypothetical protein